MVFNCKKSLKKTLAFQGLLFLTDNFYHEKFANAILWIIQPLPDLQQHCILIAWLDQCSTKKESFASVQADSMMLNTPKCENR